VGLDLAETPQELAPELLRMRIKLSFKRAFAACGAGGGSFTKVH
jgi:hypothetical protein